MPGTARETPHRELSVITGFIQVLGIHALLNGFCLWLRWVNPDPGTHSELPKLARSGKDQWWGDATYTPLPSKRYAERPRIPLAGDEVIVLGVADVLEGQIALVLARAPRKSSRA